MKIDSWNVLLTKNMYSLFIDTSSPKLCIAIYSEKKIVDIYILDNKNNHTENAVDKLFELLNKNNIEYSKISKILFTKGPGSFIGTRVALTIVKMFKIYNEKIKCYSCSSLELQRGFNKIIDSGMSFTKNKKYLLTKKNKYKIVDIDFPSINDFLSIKKNLMNIHENEKYFTHTEKINIIRINNKIEKKQLENKNFFKNLKKIWKKI